MEMVKIRSWDEYLSLPVNKWNIPEPPHDQVMENGNDDREWGSMLVDPSLNHLSFSIGKGWIGSDYCTRQVLLLYQEIYTANVHLLI